MLHSPSSSPLNIWQQSTMCWDYVCVRTSPVHRLFCTSRKHRKNGLVTFDNDWEGEIIFHQHYIKCQANNHRELADNHFKDMGGFVVVFGLVFFFTLGVNSALWEEEANLNFYPMRTSRVAISLPLPKFYQSNIAREAFFFPLISPLRWFQ